MPRNNSSDRRAKRRLDAADRIRARADKLLNERRITNTEHDVRMAEATALEEKR